MKKSYFLGMLLLAATALGAQTTLLTLQNPGNLYVCGSAPMSATISNNTDAAIQSLTLTFTLPGGVEYVPGSATNAAEQNISSLSAPVFALADLGAGESRSVGIEVRARCEAQGPINSGQLFANSATLNYLGGSVQTAGTNYVIETGLLQIVSVSPVTLSGEKGDVLVRQIRVRNTRLGRIGALSLRDAHDAGYRVSTVGSAQQNVGGILTTAQFDGAFISQFGNGDPWLDLNEEAVITQEIEIEDCGFPAKNIFSTIEIGWGCGAVVCQSDTAQALVTIQNSTKNPNLAFGNTTAYPPNSCAQSPAYQIFHITNQGSLDAKNLTLEFNTGAMDVLAYTPGSFELFDGTTSIPINPNITIPVQFPDCNTNGYQRAIFTIPLVKAGQTLELRYALIRCEPQCLYLDLQPTITTLYRKACPEDSPVSEVVVVALPSPPQITATPIVNLNACMEEGLSYPIQHLISSDLLLKDEGFLKLEFRMNPGLHWDDMCPPIAEGKLPIAIEKFDGPGERVILTYELPFNSNSVLLEYCLAFKCDSFLMICESDPDPNYIPVFTPPCPFLCRIKVDAKASIVQTLDDDPACGFCNGIDFLLNANAACAGGPGGDGEGSCVCVDDTIRNDQFLLLFKKRVFRKNIDLQDDDDDREADSNLQAQHPSIRRDRFIPGDTLRYESCFIVFEGTLSALPSFRIVHNSRRSDMTLFDGDSINLLAGRDAFTNRDLLSFVRGQTRIGKSDGGQYSCPTDTVGQRDRILLEALPHNVLPPQIYEQIIAQYYTFAPDLSACGTEATVGDTVFFTADFVFKRNFAPDDRPPLINFGIHTLFNSILELPQPPIPGAFNQYSGYVEKTVFPQHTIRGCDQSLQGAPLSYELRIARENMFPFEVRPLARLFNLRQYMPPGVNLQQALLSLARQKNQPIFVNEPVATAQNGPHTVFDLQPFFAEPLDEGLTLRLDLSYLPNCNFTLPDTSWTGFSLAYHPDLFKIPNPQTAQFGNELGFLSGSPELELQSLLNSLDVNKSGFEFDFNLRNLRSVQATNTWISIEPVDGNLEDIQLLNLPQGVPIAGLNNLYQLGTVGFNANRPLRLKAKSNSCRPFTLRIVTGWGCQPVSNPLGAECGLDTLLIALNLLNAELELDLITQPASVPLCDASDWMTIEISNARDGYAQQVTPGILLPQGVGIVPGSCQIAYPPGSPWVAVPDPQTLPGNLYEWDMAAILPGLAAEGLPGFQLNPANSFQIRFRLEAECGFVANAQPVVGVRGTQNCGIAINNIQKAGNPIPLDGVNPPYGINISLSAADPSPIYCGDAKQFQASLQLLGAPSPGDSIYLILPQGVSYVSGSYQAGQNAPTGPPVLNGAVLTLPLPLGIPVGSAIKFAFDLRYNTPEDCANRILIAQTRQQTVAFCQSTGQDCAVFVATGEALLPIPTLNAQLSLYSLNAQAGPTGLQLDIGLENVGPLTLPQAQAEIWIDANGNGQPDPGETLIQSLSYTEAIAPGQIALLIAQLNLSPDQLCRLLLYLPADANCACNSIALPLNKWRVKYDDILSCVPTSVAIGIPEAPGSAYQWQPGGLVDCATCPNTVFNPPAGVSAGSLFTLTLRETNGACLVDHVFDISFSPVPGITSPDQFVCRGESVTLSATADAAAYLWNGPGIGQPTAPTQTLTPQQSALYTVNVTLANGCSAADTVSVTVYETYAKDLGEFSTCPGKPVQMPGVLTDVPGVYSFAYPTVFGCDSIVTAMLTHRMPQSEALVSLCTGDTLRMQDLTITTEGLYCAQYLTPDGCDSTHCLRVALIPPPAISTPLDTLLIPENGSVLLEGPPGFAQYQWSPAEGLSCANCQSPEASPTEPTTYTLTVTTTDGCTAQAEYRTKPLPPCDAKRLQIPNTFTPDGDGINDTFRVAKYEGFERVTRLAIYDRWGAKVYESASNPQWDGTINGKPAPSDVYVYILEVTCADEPKQLVGDVTVMR